MTTTTTQSARGVPIGTLRALAEAGSVRAVRVIGGAKGWHIRARWGLSDMPLLSQRGQVRRFGSADSALALVREELGIGNVEVDVTHWKRRRAAAGAKEGTEMA